VLTFDTSSNNWIIASDDYDFYGASASGTTIDGAMQNFAGALNVLGQGPFQVVLGEAGER
jgi:hypothetical protein